MSSLSTQVLQMLAGGLGLNDASFAVHLNRGEPDSLLRLNHYPPCQTTTKNKDCKKSTIRFGEHTDPQMITILRSDDVPGLQIQTANGAWVPVPPDPGALFVFVGDTIQALTNGRIKSVRHRVIANSYSCSRLSFAFFCAPGLKQVINPSRQMITPQNPRRYKSFTWEEYKRVMYTLRLAHNRLDLFHVNADEEDSK